MAVVNARRARQVVMRLSKRGGEAGRLRRRRALSLPFDATNHDHQQHTSRGDLPYRAISFGTNQRGSTTPLCRIAQPIYFLSTLAHQRRVDYPK
jgi:hypothetical protein